MKKWVNGSLRTSFRRSGAALTSLRQKLMEPATEREQIARPHEYESVDVFHSLEDDDLSSFNFQGSRHERWYQRVWNFLVVEQSWLFLMILGFGGAMVVLFIDFLLDLLVRLRTRLVFEVLDHVVLRLLVWFGFAGVFAVISAGSVHLMSPHAAGSGIPAIKSLLGGIVMNQYLTFRTFTAKVVGTLASFASGLSIGKEGPYVHICAIVASQLASLPLFRRIRQNDSLKLQMVAAGCAVAVATTFGAPLGGVLFSIEVTSTYYLIQNLWKGFYCAVCGSLFVRLVGSMGLVALFSTKFAISPYTPLELLAFAAVGALFGLLAVLFIKGIRKLGAMRRKYRVLVEYRYTQVVVVAMVLSCLAYPLPYMRNDTAPIINGLFSESDVQGIGKPVILNLVIMSITKAVMTAVSIVLPIPCGLYTPVFMIGASLGRLVGEVLAMVFGSHIIPGGYAVVGAAAFAGSVTRTLSTTMIIFELTGQLQHMVPVMLAVLVGCAVANIFTSSVYDTLLEDKGLPYMPPFTPKAGRETVSDIMEPRVAYVARDMRYNDLVNLLVRSSTVRSFPLVDTPSRMTLQGQISRSALLTLLSDRERLYEQRVEARIINKALNAPAVGKKSRERHQRFTLEAIEHYDGSLLDGGGRRSAAAASVSDKAEAYVVDDDDDDDDDDVVVVGDTRDAFDEEGEDDSDLNEMEEVDDDDAYGARSRLHHSSSSGSLSSQHKTELILQDEKAAFFDAVIEPELPLDRIDPCPFQMVAETPLSKAHFMFSMLSPSQAYITRDGRLVGILSKERMAKTLRKDCQRPEIDCEIDR